MISFVGLAFKKKRNASKMIANIYSKDDIPFLKVKIANRIFNIMIDTGASGNVFDKSVLSLIKEDCPELMNIGKDTVVAGFGHEQDVDVYRVPMFLNKNKYDMDISFADLNIKDTIKENYDMDILGVIGYEFFEKNKYILDFYKKKIFKNY